MKTISLTVNGKECRATVEPRTSLADFLREDLLLTGTNLGCEHGVCGACTVTVDGDPVRSCILYAVACEGKDVHTIEGYDEDRLMADLRDAFSSEHALQCGYCTPGMLITSRDIVKRLTITDEDRIRSELSGNLCRCTGYVGIVNAVRHVIEDKIRVTETIENHDLYRSHQEIGEIVLPSEKTSTELHSGERSPQQVMADKPGRLEQTFAISHPRAAVWTLFQDLPSIVSCMPGASLDAVPNKLDLRGQLAVKLGPIRAIFSGTGEVEYDDTNYSGVIRGSGQDREHGSQVRGEVYFELLEEPGSPATRVNVNIAFALSGVLAQFSRGSIINNLADQLTETFAVNLRAMMERIDDTEQTLPHGSDGPAELDIFSLVIRAIFGRVRSAIMAGLKRMGL